MTMRRKGVSPVIATLLLIVVAVAAAVLTYIWVTGYIGRTTSAAEASQLQERIKINAVSYDSNTNSVTISVANIGDVQVNITAAYVLTEGGTQTCGGTLNGGTTISPGAIEDVNVNGGCTLTSGTTYVAKVVTRKGTEATYTFTP